MSGADRPAVPVLLAADHRAVGVVARLGAVSGEVERDRRAQGDGVVAPAAEAGGRLVEEFQRPDAAAACGRGAKGGFVHGVHLKTWRRVKPKAAEAVRSSNPSAENPLRFTRCDKRHSLERRFCVRNRLFGRRGAWRPGPDHGYRTRPAAPSRRGGVRRPGQPGPAGPGSGVGPAAGCG